MPAKKSVKHRETAAHPKRFSLVPASAQQQMYRLLDAMKPALFARASGSEIAEIAACLALGEQDAVISAGSALGAQRVRKLLAPAGRGKRCDLREATVQAVRVLLERDGASALICGGRIAEHDEYRDTFRFAGQFRLPILYLVANSLDVPKKQQHDLRTLYAEFGIPVFSVDANDAIAVYRVVTEALHNARHGRGACVIEALNLPDSPLSREAALQLLEGYMRRHGSWPV